MDDLSVAGNKIFLASTGNRVQGGTIKCRIYLRAKPLLPLSEVGVVGGSGDSCWLLWEANCERERSRSETKCAALLLATGLEKSS